MKYSLRTKLSLSYIFVALVSVAIISFLMNFMLEKQFQSYVIKNIEQQNKEIVAGLTGQYQANLGWQPLLIEDLGVRAIGDGLMIRLEDSEGNTIWSALEHNHGLCQTMLQEITRNMNSRYPGIKGNYVEVPYSITHNNIEVGKVYIGYYGPFYLNDNDLHFINTLNQLLVGAGVFSMALALIIGTIMAKRLSKPIAKVIKATEMISKGYYHDLIKESSNTIEIEQLTDSVNQLALNLDQQEILRKRLTADVAHELRTPIATLQSHMEAMIDGVWEPNTNRLESCHEEIVRIGRLVGDLEKLAKYESENLKLNIEQFDLSAVITSILNNFQNDFLSKSIHVTFTSHQIMIEADQDKIRQVIVNLLSNAIKYTQDSGEVEITLKEDKDELTLIVKDNGIGIPKKDIPVIFERFYRTDQSRNRLTGGSGIGLAIVKAIVDAHKGNIIVDSELNIGTTVEIRIPKKSTGSNRES